MVFSRTLAYGSTVDGSTVAYIAVALLSSASLLVDYIYRLLYSLTKCTKYYKTIDSCAHVLMCSCVHIMLYNRSDYNVTLPYILVY